jgi:hypothetical protein
MQRTRLIVTASALVACHASDGGSDAASGDVGSTAGSTAGSTTAPTSAPGESSTGGSVDDDDDDDDDDDGSDDDATGVPADPPTWHRDIAAVIHGNCQPCHSPPIPLAPFALLDYNIAKPLAPLIALVTASGEMPPFPADETDECHPRFGWKDDLRLTEVEKQLLADWAAAGAPEGDPADAGPLPGPPAGTLPDANIELTIEGEWLQPRVAADAYRCFSMDPALVADQWINGVEVVPGNEAIVHHVTVLVDPTAFTANLGDQTGSYECFSGGLDGTVLAYVWAPGTQPLKTPDLSGIHVPVGSRIAIQVHYHSNAAADEIDNATTVRLRATDIPPQRTLSFASFGATTPESVGLQPGPNDPGQTPLFYIPGGAVGHRETFITQLNLAAPVVRLFSVWPHMHIVGTDMKIDLTRVSPNAAQPPQECLVQTPSWDFHSQRNYLYDLPIDALPTIATNDVLTLRCTYDNNVTNEHLVQQLLWEQGVTLPEEIQFSDVLAGESSTEEMCAVLLGVVY